MRGKRVVNPPLRKDEKFMETMYAGIIAASVILLIVIFNKKRNSPSVGSSTEQDIIDAVNEGRKIEAIKHYRFVHNVGLKEAKEAIDRMQEKS
jgi:ribosomal protein L7/L12